MTFEMLAKLVADDFCNTIEKEGFETFSEMKKCYCWDAQDIKDEVRSIVDDLSKVYWEKEKVSFFMADDSSFLEIGVCEEMSWREFKKLVFSYLN